MLRKLSGTDGERRQELRIHGLSAGKTGGAVGEGGVRHWMLPRYDLGSREKFRLERLLPDQRYALTVAVSPIKKWAAPVPSVIDAST